MQTTTSAFQRALLRSHTPIDLVEVWRGGKLLVPDLKVSSGKITVSGGNGQVVKSQCNITVISNDGKLVPENYDDPLAPFGSELRVKMGLRLGGEDQLVTMNWFTLVNVEIDEVSDYRVRPSEPDNPQWFSKGAVIDIESSDRMYNIEKDKFTYRQQPKGSTVFAELPNLLDIGRPPYGGVTGSVSNKNIPSDLTYDTDRLKAVLNLANLVDTDPYIDPNGLFKLLSRTNTSVVWRLEKGQFSVLYSAKRKMTREGVYNGALETSTADNDRPLQAGKFTSDGPLVWGGPFGRVPLLHSSPLLTTQDQVNSAVQTVYTRATQLTPQEIPITCPRNPALQWGDIIELPTRTGYVAGTITSLEYPFGTSQMQLVIAADPFATQGLI